MKSFIKNSLKKERDITLVKTQWDCSELKCAKLDDALLGDNTGHCSGSD